MTVDDGADAFLTEAHAVEGGLEVEGTVDDAAAEGARLGLGDDLEVIDGIGEGLGADLLGTVDEGDAGLLDAEGVADVVDIVDLLAALGLGGHGDDGGVGEEEELLVLGDLGHRNMGEHVARAQDAILLVEDGAQEGIGVDESLHEDVGLAALAEIDGSAGALVLVVAIDIDRFDEAHLHTFLYGVAGAGITGADNGYAPLVTSFLKEDDHVVQGLNWLHRLLIFGFMLQIYEKFCIFASENG